MQRHGALSALLGLILTVLTAGAGMAAMPSVIPVSTATVSDAPLVIFYSGDGGWARTDRVICSRLVQRGLPVVGVDALHYFWRHRAPEGAAADLAAIMRHYGPRQDFILMGYSFGADALPLIVRDLPADLLARVRLLALVAPGDRGELVLRPNSWFDIPGKGAEPIAPVLAAMPHLKVLCAYGDRDRHAACPRLAPGLRGRVTVLELPGGHHLKGQEGLIAAAVAAARP